MASMLLCTMVRNQTKNYIVEWIEFHRIQGFGQFRMYVAIAATWQPPCTHHMPSPCTRTRIRISTSTHGHCGALPPTRTIIAQHVCSAHARTQPARSNGMPSNTWLLWCHWFPVQLRQQSQAGRCRWRRTAHHGPYARVQRPCGAQHHDRGGQAEPGGVLQRLLDVGRLAGDLRARLADEGFGRCCLVAHSGFGQMLPSAHIALLPHKKIPSIWANLRPPQPPYSRMSLDHTGGYRLGRHL